ncbi:hypothetical protein [Sharpea azabuensis]|uniref:hypothetical protein n=1 Tax=Sharpea azabuensis TaxID=322505 RepID=UPI003CFFD6BA
MKQYRSTIIAFFKNKENSTRKTSIRHRRNTQRTISRSLAAHNQAGFVDSFREACNKLSIKQAELLEKLCNKLLMKLKMKAKSNRRPTIQINDGRSFKNIFHFE